MVQTGTRHDVPGDPDWCPTTRHVAKRRLQAAKQDQVEVKLTAVIADDGETLSTAQKVERTQAFILNNVPATEFLRHKHAQMSLDANARSVIPHLLR